MKYSIIVLVVFLIASCVRSPGGRDDGELDNMDAIKLEVISSFDEDPSGSFEKYKRYWKERHEEKGLTVAEEVKLLGIAREMMNYDKASYQEYYGYVVSRLESDNFYIRNSAIDALGTARGSESIDLLITYAKVSSSDVAIGALTALEYRLLKSKYDGSIRDDYKYAKERVDDMCARDSRQLIEQFCSRLN